MLVVCTKDFSFRIPPPDCVDQQSERFIYEITSHNPFDSSHPLAIEETGLAETRLPSLIPQGGSFVTSGGARLLKERSLHSNHAGSCWPISGLPRACSTLPFASEQPSPGKHTCKAIPPRNDNEGNVYARRTDQSGALRWKIACRRR